MRYVKKTGRSEWIRTTDPCLPKTVLYQAELHSATNAPSINRTSPPRNWRRQLIHLPETLPAYRGKPGTFITNGRKSMQTDTPSINAVDAEVDEVEHG